MQRIDWSAIRSPIIFAGDTATAYRDPAAIYHDGLLRLFFTLVRTENDGNPYLYTAVSSSRDLLHWAEPRLLTPRERRLNYSSPGNVVRDGDKWVLCLQTYPRPNGEKYGNQDARLFAMRSPDIEQWGPPELLRVKGAEVPEAEMGRMIDPYLLRDREEPDKWWCLYKQNGMSMSWSHDLREWTYFGRAEAGENVCVLVEANEYVLFHSPENGIGVKRSPDLLHWRDEGLMLLGQDHWPWARGRLTAGFVLDLRSEPAVGRYMLFFHGSGPEDEGTMFDTHASLGLAWSDDLRTWHWPGQ